jgi:hypothetical protein
LAESWLVVLLPHSSQNWSREWLIEEVLGMLGWPLMDGRWEQWELEELAKSRQPKLFRVDLAVYVPCSKTKKRMDAFPVPALQKSQHALQQTPRMNGCGNWELFGAAKIVVAFATSFEILFLGWDWYAIGARESRIWHKWLYLLVYKSGGSLLGMDGYFGTK